MKIVMVTPSVPHPFANTAARWYDVLCRGLARRGHRVTCFSCSEEKASLVGESEQLLSGSGVAFKHFPQKIDPNPLRRKFRNLMRPFSELAQQAPLRHALEHELKTADILHLEQLVTGWLENGFPQTLLNIHFLESIDWGKRDHLSWAEKKEFFQMKRAAKKILGKATHICSLTERLRQEILLINPKAKTWVTPLGLDLSLYPLLPPVKEPVIGMLGSMHWYPSRSAAIHLITQIWPLIQTKVPHCKLLIAGWNAKKYLSQYLPRPGISLEENLKHPSDFFSRISVMVYAPERGS